ncbi:MAG: transporter substrate-binding protein [Subtercola sp.]|nr:transporter substrate-binding protein [Subtercola sp.]
MPRSLRLFRAPRLRSQSRRAVVGVVLSGFLVMAVSGCAVGAASASSESASGTGNASSSSSSAGGVSNAGSPITIVASTSVYGDIATAIGADTVSVTSIIDDPNKDPHDYQADGQNALSVSKASIVIENGGGYDDFMSTLITGTKNSGAVVLNAAALSGYDLEPSSGSFNEHLWYDFGTVTKVVDRLASALTDLAPEHAALYRANALSYTDSLASLSAAESDLKNSFAGTGAAITEPVAEYLLNASGLVDQTPLKFSAAVENGSDVAPDVLAATIALFASHQVAVLVYNSQTSDPQTEAVLAAAKAASVPVVPVTESLPDGSSYLTWMAGTLAAMKTALSQ